MEADSKLPGIGISKNRVEEPVLAGTRKQTMLPRATRDRLDIGDRSPRLVADLLAGMTERQVIQNYQRLTGILPWPMSHFDL